MTSSSESSTSFPLATMPPNTSNSGTATIESTSLSMSQELNDKNNASIPMTSTSTTNMGLTNNSSTNANKTTNPSSPYPSSQMISVDQQQQQQQQQEGIQQRPQHEQPQQQQNQAPATMTPALRVRAHLLRRILASLSSLATGRKFYLSFTTLLTFAQVVSFIVVLALTANDECDSNLREYLIVQVVRLCLAFVPSFYRFLIPQRPSPRNDTPELANAREMIRLVGSPTWDRRMSVTGDIISLFAFFWFIIGNVWLFSSKTCQETSPPLYYTTLASLALGFLYAAELLLIVCAVSFCLPCVIVFIRMLNLSPKPDIGPLAKTQIDKIPLVIYIPQDEQDKDKDDNNNKTSNDQENNLAASQSTSIYTKHDDDDDATHQHKQSNNEPQESQDTTTSNQHFNSNLNLDQNQNQNQLDNGSALTVHSRRTRFLRLFVPLRRKIKRYGGSSRRKKPNGSDTNNCNQVKDEEQNFEIGQRSYAPGPYPFHPLSENAATCAICLCDFEEPPLAGSPSQTIQDFEYEPLRLLKCGHALHKDCIDPWLQTSGRCPICQAPIYGNGDAKNNNSTSSENNADNAV